MFSDPPILNERRDFHTGRNNSFTASFSIAPSPVAAGLPAKGPALQTYYSAHHAQLGIVRSALAIALS